MHSFSFALPMLAVCVSLVVAQTATAATAATTYSCQAQNILDSCLATENLQMTKCDQSNYDCLCTASQNVLTCYYNCPGHPGQSAAQGTNTSYCNAAAQLSSLTATSTHSSTTLSSSTTSETTATPTESATPTTTSGSSTAQESKGAAAGLVVESGSLLAAMLVGLVAL